PEVEITPVAAAEAAAGLGSDVIADLWIPDSSLWAEQVVADGVTLTPDGPVATSPLVVVAPKPVAEQLGWPDTEFSWDAVVGGEANATIADPTATGEGLATLLAVGAAVGVEEADRTQLVQAMTAVARAAVPDVATAYEQLTGDPVGAPLFTATEQSVVAHNTATPDSPVAALYPAEGTMIFDYPAIAVTTAATTSARSAAVAAFSQALGTPEAVAILQDAGFRAPDGEARGDAGVVDGIQAAMPTALPTPEPTQAAQILRQWAALSIDSQLLAVIDASGSMNEQVSTGQTRIELTRDAAKAALALFPDTSSIGLWAFSVNQDPPNDHVELVPVGPLTDPVGEVTRKEALVVAVDELPDRAEGGTALYDTTLAAFRTVRAIYDPEKINSVVLLTDGRNEDDPVGIDLDSLLTTLRTEVDPARPIPIITIGMGPEADLDALTQISEVSGAKAYRAEDPADIQQVFLDAMVERQCRPVC
ncbi:MAG: substrate-binding domain-containing protein, partial [Acidimicrobiales bacterium]